MILCVTMCVGESAAAASEGASKDKDAKEDRQMRNTDFFVFNDAFQYVFVRFVALSHSVYFFT